MSNFQCTTYSSKIVFKQLAREHFWRITAYGDSAESKKKYMDSMGWFYYAYRIKLNTVITIHEMLDSHYHDSCHD